MGAVKGNDGVDFRDRIATVDGKGKRQWIFAVKPQGTYYNYRTALSYVYFLLFFSLPFISIEGRPLFLFNIPEAKFILFSKVFWPQDFFLFGVVMIGFIFFIILFTAAFGRLFCGWMCPQTIFMEMLFRKLEYWIVGSANEQKLLKEAPFSGKKAGKLLLKHASFFLLSFLIANCFLAYIIGVKALEKIVTEPLSQHVAGFFSILIFTGVFYGVYAFFREQVCTAVCPYGRLQGVLIDKNTMSVAYDYGRGEPRGRGKKSAEEERGDCVDCFQCVRVCPTGIDIRNGNQMECVGCTACIDACNDVMAKMKKPLGLIRYTSENAISDRTSFKYTGRMKLYTALCVAVLALLGVLLNTRKDIDATVIRTPGILFQERGADSISNLYSLKMINKTITAIPVTVRLENVKGAIQMIGHNEVIAASEGQGSGTFFVILPRTVIQQRKTSITLGFYQGNKKIASAVSTFAGPVSE
ncbi:cytochrome c oxidase accessory protein FixG [Filimonas lacunae]|uniref:Cytochrome c oxidase accessory protein FixG n=1 Tax=Filimonas lacunae TaxID=477680 RepID=A0A173MPB2_9BACT|nr:cytochrome c oxidase accessory protein CcoG [Filimonas lacunae]BAV09231.1 type cbb3 cytochrome oxidase biogenesis protein CcoG [Filimonas lacunae]SIS69417.1 cytochrome c oxidase accessory protein FixG [Filimonas lacunae]